MVPNPQSAKNTGTEMIAFRNGTEKLVPDCGRGSALEDVAHTSGAADARPDGGSPSTIRLSMKITIALDLSAGEGRRLARRKAADAIATDYDYLDNNDYDNNHPDNVGGCLQHPDNAADS